jgi:hypothetical protein
MLYESPTAKNLNVTINNVYVGIVFLMSEWIIFILVKILLKFKFIEIPVKFWRSYSISLSLHKLNLHSAAQNMVQPIYLFSFYVL